MFGGGKYRWRDYRLDSAGPSGPNALTIQKGRARLPGVVDLRPSFGPVQDQGWLQDGSVAFVVTAVAEFILREDPGKGAWSQLSVLHQHQQTVGMMQRLGRQGPPSILMGMSALFGYGAKRESDWPSMPDRLNTAPPILPDRSSISFVATDVQDVWSGADGVFRTVAEGRPVMFRYVGPEEHLKEAGLTGQMPKWKGKVKSDADPPGHAMLVVGYDAAADMLIVRNSFGVDWGDQGHFRMPMETFRAQATGLMAAGPYQADRYSRLMGESYPGEKERDAGHRKFMDVLMSESYPGENERDGGHRKFIAALMGNEEQEAGHRRVIDMIWGGGYSGSFEQDRAHQTFLSALMGGRFAQDAHGEIGARGCAQITKEAGLKPFEGSDMGGIERGAEMGARGGASSMDRLDRLARDVRRDVSDATDDASRDFRSRLRRQEDEVMRGPRRDPGRNPGGGRGGSGDDGQGGGRS